jgi:hypothetical protein
MPNSYSPSTDTIRSTPSTPGTDCATADRQADDALARQLPGQRGAFGHRGDFQLQRTDSGVQMQAVAVNRAREQSTGDGVGASAKALDPAAEVGVGVTCLASRTPSW